MKNIKKINICEVCDNSELLSVLDMGDLPLCDDLIPKNSKKICREYPTEILFCNNCYTAHHKYQVDKELLFPKSYHYRARFTADVLNGMKELVGSLIKNDGSIKEKLVLDIGCNDGSLLNEFKKNGAITIGVEPTGAYKEAENNKHKIINDYLSYEVAKNIVKDHGKMDIITFTNVFAHIDDLKSLIKSLRELIKSTTIIIIENHYLGSVLISNQFDTFYHEHPRSYSYNSFKHIAKAIGLKINFLEFPDRYGGNIRVFMSSRLLNNINKPIDDLQILNEESKFLDNFKMLNKNILKWKISKKNQIELLFNKYGKLAAKAFPGRAAILIKMLNLSEKHILCVFEKSGSKKINHYVPGTRILISSDDILFSLKAIDAPLINLAWHIPNEIREYLIKNNFKGKVIDIIEKKDFN